MTWDGKTAIQFARFLVVGVINTLFGQGMFFLLVYLGLHPQLALLLATIAGVLFNFQSIGRLVFRDESGRFWRFVAAYVFSYAVNALLLAALIRSGLSPYLAQGVLVLPVAVLTFVMNRRFVFARTEAGTT